MTRKLIIALTALLVIAFAVPAYAAITDGQKKEILDLQKQMAALKKQIVQKYVDSGEITKEEGKTIQDNIDKWQDYAEKNPDAIGPIGGGCGGGQGMMTGPNGQARIRGMMGGSVGGMMGGYAPTGTLQGI